MSIPSTEKQPSESRLFWIECAGRLVAGETISGVTGSATVSPTTLSPLTISGVTVSGSQIQFRAAGGLTNTRYKVTFLYTTSLSNTREAEIIFQVEDE